MDLEEFRPFKQPKLDQEEIIPAKLDYNRSSTSGFLDEYSNITRVRCVFNLFL